MSLTQQQKDKIRTDLNVTLGKTLTDSQLNRIIREIEINTADPLPEKILTCSKCGQNIVAYGLRGVAFITEYASKGVKYYHGTKCP